MTTEPTILVAFDLEVRDGYENLPRSVVEHALTRLLPRSGDSLYDQGPGHFGQVDSWWVAEDDRHDGSDRDSAIFVPMGTQTAELFDRLPDEARETIRAALQDGFDYRDDNGGHCSYCDEEARKHTGPTDPPLCEDHEGDRLRAASYRDLLDLIGA